MSLMVVQGEYNNNINNTYREDGRDWKGGVNGWLCGNCELSRHGKCTWPRTQEFEEYSIQKI